MTEKQTQAAYQALKRMYYDICSLYFSKLPHDSDKWQAVQQRKIALGNLLFSLDIDEPYTGEIEYLAKHHMKLKQTSFTAPPKLNQAEAQKAISLYYESLVAQNAAYHDQLLIWQLPDRLIDITDINKPSFNSNYTERINGYYIALLAIGIDENLLRKLQDTVFNQIWHSSLSANGSNQYDLYFGLKIPNIIKLSMPYRDLRSLQRNDENSSNM